MKFIIIIFFYFFLNSCSSLKQEKFINSKYDNLIVTLKNDTINIPLNFNSIDTLNFEIINYSDTTFYFGTNDTAIYFSNTSTKEKLHLIHADPGNGLIFRLLDYDYNTIETEIHSGYTGDDFSPFLKNEFVYLKSKELYNFNYYAKYPIRNQWGGVFYTIKDFAKVKYIDIVFDFNNFETPFYIEDFNFKFKNKEKPAKGRFVFRRPVKLIKK